MRPPPLTERPFAVPLRVEFTETRLVLTPCSRVRCSSARRRRGFVRKHLALFCDAWFRPSSVWDEIAEQLSSERGTFL
jgi:hypothetical protein